MGAAHDTFNRAKMTHAPEERPCQKHWPQLGIENVGDSTFEDDKEVFLASIAISLKRIADAMTQSDQYGQTGSAAISQAIKDGMRDAR